MKLYNKTVAPTEDEVTTTDIPPKFRGAYYTGVVARKAVKYGLVLGLGAMLYKSFTSDTTIVVEN